MAQVIGAPGRTGAHVRVDRLMGRSSGWAWLLPTVGAGSAAVIWGIGGAGAPAVTVAAFALAAAGILWMLATSAPVVRRACGGALAAVEYASAAADLAIAAGIGGIAGLIVAQTAAAATHGEAAAVGMAAILIAVWARLRASVAMVARLHAGAEGEQEVASMLDTLPEGFVVLHDVTIPAGAGHCEVDHIVLGPTGVFVMETKRWGGVLTPGESVWVQDGRYGRRTYPSPVVQLRREQRAVADRLQIPTDQVTPILVLAAGHLSGEAGVQMERPRTLLRAVTTAPSRWPLAAAPRQAAAMLARVGR